MIVQVDLLLEASVAVYVTVLIPIEKVEPGAKFEVNETPGQLSEAVGATQLALVEQTPASAFLTIDEGQPVIKGF